MSHDRWIVFLIASAALTAGPVLADDSATPDRVYALGDTVRVESDRLPLDPLRATMATTVLSASAWKNDRGAGLDEALRTVPGLLAQSRSGGQDVRIAIRGFGARGAGDRSNAGTTRGVRIQLNGFPLTEPDGRTSLDLADLGAIQTARIVRSNASALFGSASGGLVDLYTTAPFQQSFYATSVNFGDFGFAKQAGELGLISGRSQIRLQLSTSNSDGWRKQSSNAQSTIQTSIETELSDKTSLDLYLSGTRNLQRQPGALTEDEFEDDPRQAAASYAAQNSRRDNRIGRVAARVDHHRVNGATYRLSGYVEPKTLHRSERNRYRDFQRVHTGGSAIASWPVSFGGEPKLRWTVGIDEAYQDGSVLFYNLAEGGQRGPDRVADTREGINTFGIFTEVAARPAPRWDLSLGARMDYVHWISEDHIDSKLDDTRTLDRATPRAALGYRLTDRQSIYASIASGIEAPAFNEVDPPAPFDTLTSLNPLLEPAHSVTFEVGSRGRLPFGRGDSTDFNYDIAVYTLTVENDIVPFDGGAYYTTVGEAKRSGIELGLDAASDYGLSGHITGAFSKNEYVRYENDLGVFDDNEAAGIPGTVVDLGVRYAHAKGPYGAVGMRHTGEYFANDANTDKADAFTTFDLTLGVDRNIAGTRADLFVSVRNLTDEKYVASVFINGVDGRFIEPGLERNIVVGVKLRGGI